jgi:EAL domain-containing protein (putative c-di-GMP-specific phosphodiesterase class I)
MTIAVQEGGTRRPDFAQLLAYFAQWNGRPSVAVHGIDLDGGEARGCFDDLCLHSVYQPLFHAGTLLPMAFEALLRARRRDGTSVPPQQAFRYPDTPEEIVYFDRLCRTVHAINFAAQAEAGETLYLNVDARHLLSVEGSHGAAFEGLLRHCGLKPSQVVLEILESGIDDLGHLARAVSAYQERGYRIAIDDFGCQHSNFDRLWRLSPDIVKLDRELIVQAAGNLRTRIILPKLIDIIHDLGGLVVCEGIETAEQHELAVRAGADLLQGFLYARPAFALQRLASRAG